MIERIPNPNCPHCKGTGHIAFADIPGDIFECKCTHYPPTARDNAFIEQLRSLERDAARYRMLRFLLCEDDNDRWPALGTTELQLDDEIDKEIRDAKGRVPR